MTPQDHMSTMWVYVTPVPCCDRSAAPRDEKRAFTCRTMLMLDSRVQTITKFLYAYAGQNLKAPE